VSKSNKYPIDHTLISPNAIKVVTKLQQKGYEAYLVGGCIRDILLNKSPKDFDVVTSAHPEQVKHVFRNCRLIGRRFRLAHILFGREIIEVATFRSNANHKNKAKSDEGRVLQDNQYGTSLKDDAIRRDFTINALCYDPVKKKIFDFTSGLKDIDKGQIKILGKPEERYKEDPVRMLRAIRFKAKLGFKIEKHTFNAIDECRDTLYCVPPARLFDESLKMFQTGHALESFN
jgi:poly(A) polymerase